MHEGKIVHFEDNISDRRFVLRILAGTPHQVVGEAESKWAAIDVLDRIQAGDLDANVVILDGNLSEGADSGADARELAEAIRERSLKVRVIGMSGRAMSVYGVEVDFDVVKGALARGHVDLKEVIDDLPEIEA